MNINEINEDDVLVLAISGRLDSTTARHLEEVLPERIQTTARLIVDMADVQYVSSAGLRVILKTAKIARSTGHRLVLAGLAPQVLEVFEVSGFSAIFNIEQDRSAALQGFV